MNCSIVIYLLRYKSYFMFFPQIYNSWKPKQFEKYEMLAKQIDLKKLFHKKRVLDIASGPCWFEEFLSAQSIDVSNFIAVDKNLKHLLERNAQVPAICADVGNFHIDDKFDVIIAMDCLHLFGFDFSAHLKKNSVVLASMFFSSGMEEKRKLLWKKLKGLKIQKEIIAEGEENELFLLAVA